MSKHILRWQIGLYTNEVKLYYTYGHIDILRQKAEVLAKDDKILFISIDRVEEVIKDIRSEKLIEEINKNTITKNGFEKEK